MKVINSDTERSTWLEIENASGQRQRYIRGDGMKGPQVAHVVGLPKSPACTRELGEEQFPNEIIGEMNPSLPADLGGSIEASPQPYYRFKKDKSSPGSWGRGQ